MTKWRNVLVAMVLCVGLLLVCVPQANAAISEYWQVDEYWGPSQYDGATDVWFAVDNQHDETDALAGFVVTLNPEHIDYIFDRGTATDWRAEIVYDDDEWDFDSWSFMTTSSDPQVKRSAQWFFGGTWEELFGEEDTYAAIMFWSAQNETPPNSIPAGERWGDSNNSPFHYTYGDEGGGASTAAIRMQSGLVAHGEVGVRNSFPTDGPVIPEPATITLLGLGLIGAALRRRRK